MTAETGTFSIFGMFRSGTTLMARMLNTHRDIACASDPYRPFFNYLRYNIAVDAGLADDIGPYDPLGDYFADADGLALLRAVEDGSLNRPFPRREANRLLEQICDQGEPFSAKLIDCLEEIEGETFREVYDDLLTLVLEAYGTGDERWRATKEVWTTEFVPALAETYPKMRFILVIRDPRAVCASKNIQKDTKYPWLFLVRQWRKIADLTNRYADGQRFSDRVTVLRYEDLVTEPRETAKRICDFLDINLDERVLKPGLFTDGSGDQWIQNTSYDDEEPEFNTDSVDKWKDVLDDRIVRYVEQLCLPEMVRFGYEPSQAMSLDIDDDLLLDPPMVPQNELANWIKPYFADRTQLTLQQAVATERLRQRYLRASETTLVGVDDETVAAFFQGPELFTDLRSTMEEFDA
jgi:macrodomain Ter protein organizer (MatP/YcbG family)